MDASILEILNDNAAPLDITDDKIDCLVLIVCGTSEFHSTFLRDYSNMVLLRMMESMAESRDSILLIKSMETMILLIGYANASDNRLLRQALYLLTAKNEDRVRLVAAETLRRLILDCSVETLLGLVYNLIRSNELEEGFLLLRLMQSTSRLNCWQAELSESAKDAISFFANSFGSLVNIILDRHHPHSPNHAAALEAAIETCAALAASGGCNSSNSFSSWCKVEEDLLRLVLTLSLPWDIWLRAALAFRTLLSVSLASSDSSK